MTSEECCDPGLGGAPGCDPFYQPNLAEMARYDRHSELPDTATCVCEEGQPASCADMVDTWCEAPLGSESGPNPVTPAGDYALPLVTQLGGVRWYEDRERIGFHVANRGNVHRADTEQCAVARGLIGGRSPAEFGLDADKGVLGSDGSRGWVLDARFLSQIFGSGWRMAVYS